jgi:hypothetical protein
MQSKTIKYTILLILASLLLATGCNADASAGLFRQISESSAPIGIVYKQLLGISGGELFFTTERGLYKKTSGSSSIQIKANSEGDIIQAAYNDAINSKVSYLVNGSDDAADIVIMKEVSTTLPFTDTTITTPPSYASITASSLKIKNLYPNGLYFVQGENSSNDKIFSLVTYASPNFAKVVDFTGGLNDYSLAAVLQMSGSEAQTLSANHPMIISFVNGTTYKHFYTDGTNSYEITLNKALAAFSIATGKLYLLTIDGILYYAGTAPVAGAITSPTLMIDTSKTYASNAFFYAVTDGSNTNIITKSTSINDPLYVYNFPNTTTDGTNVSTTSIRKGYGEYLNSAVIVSSLQLSANTLLIATNKNGMYEITIIPANANVDDTTNGTTSESEAYTF